MYPDVDTEVSAYRACVAYDGVETRLVLPGGHDSFDAARARALQFRQSLMAMGETGLRARVGYSGERPEGFPRNGVDIDPPRTRPEAAGDGSPLLTRVGQALYGDTWQSELSRALGVSDRTVRRWVAGVGEPSRGVYMDLLRLVEERAAELDDLIEPLKRSGAP